MRPSGAGTFSVNCRSKVNPLVSAACLLAFVTVANAASLTLLPSQFTFTGPASRQQLVVVHSSGGKFLGQVTNDLTFTSSNERVVRIEGDTAVPVRNGSATITARAGRQSAKVAVSVTGMDKPFEWSFRNHVQPVLAKAGCSSGACHGAAAGQGGFRLSLRGYDDEGDHRALTRHALGRRIVPGDPGRSLVLLKPTSTIPHKGSKRFDVDSLEYKILSEWIAEGAQGPRADEARIARLEVLPDLTTLQPGATQQLLVRAHFSDGSVQDVTRWAKYTDANAAVTAVNDTGSVTVLGHGEGAITAWYLSRIATATVTVPYTNKVAAAVFAKAPRRNFIDDLATEKLRELNLPPSPRSGDSEFLRRAFLDTIGLPPAAAEAREFLADPSLKKRDALIERLLARPEFVDYWTYKWSDLLLVNSDKFRPAAMWSYYNWIRSHVAANTPWDRFVRELVTARGSTAEMGAGNFFVLHDDPTTMAETTTVAFMGLSITCAKCHNHPMEKWTNDEYFGFANLFARVRAKNGAAEGERIIFAAAEGDIIQPLTGKPQKPRPLDGKPLAFDAPGDRRDVMASWLVSRDNPYFSRSIANRVWANFMGVGLVEAVDDLRVTNPASNEKLLTALGRHLADRNFDLKALMRAILQSETYQRTSAALPSNAADTRFYSHYYPKRLMAEVLLDSYSHVTGVPTDFFQDKRNANQGRGPAYPVGFRALQLPDTKTDSYFLRTFGRPDRDRTCECERTGEPSMAQALHIANGDTLNRKLAAKGNRLEQQLASGTPDAQLVEDVFLAALARFPTEAEKTTFTDTLAACAAAGRRALLEDIYWSLMSSREFLFNH